MNIDPTQMAQISEQAESGMISIAKILGSYYKTLIEEGFAPEQAFALVLDYQQYMFPSPIIE